MAIDGQDIVNALIDARRRGADSTRLAELHSLLRGNPPIDILADHATRIGQIIQGTYKEERHISKAVRYWVDQTNGSFSTAECYKDLNIADPKSRATAQKALTRLLQEGIIERYGNKNGVYVLIPKVTEQDMDYKNADPNNHIVFNWPLNIQRKTRIFPKSVVIVAGVTGTGKTTFLLDFIYLNQQRWPIVLFNSEMAPEAMNYKLSQYDFPVDAWTFRMRRWRGRPDEIDANGITIIDYLSAPPDKPYMIKEPIDKILTKLDQGICIIAIQKKKGSDWGMGGVWSAMDTTLNINLEFGRLEIAKNRFREADEFKGLDMRAFDVRAGHIVEKSGWYGDASEEDRKERKKKERKKARATKEVDRQLSEYTEEAKQLFPESREPGDDTEFEKEE